MDPRRFKTLTTSTPSVANPSATFGLPSEASDPSTISGSSSLVTGKMTVKHDEVFPKMTYLEWVLMAIETVGVPRKGASYIAILKWIVNNKENVVINRLKANLRKAIEKALENGFIKRPAISKDVTGLRGYFIKNKDAITAHKITKTKPARKLVEITNVTEIQQTKTTTAKTKPSANVKSKAAKSTKPIKLLTKSAKPNHNAGAAIVSSKPKTQLKSKAEKTKTDALEIKPKNHIKAKSSKPTSSKDKILHNAVRINPAAEDGPSNKRKTQPKSKAAKSTLDVIAEPSTIPKTRAKARTTKPNLDVETVSSNKPKTQPKLKATKINVAASAEPRIIPKTGAKTRTAKTNNDAERGPKKQPTDIAAEPNLDVEVKLKTRPKARAAKPSHDDKAKPKVLPKSIAFEINLDTDTGSETLANVLATESNPDADYGPETHPKVIGKEPNPVAEHSSLLKTTPPKTKAAVKPRPGKHPIPVLKDMLPHQKAASKTLKASKKIDPKRLYKPSEELPLNISREEYSDKESNMKPQRSNVSDVDRRNSYVSDSEVICNTKVAKATKITKNLEVKKLNKKETLEAGSSRANKRRGKNNSADV